MLSAKCGKIGCTLGISRKIEVLRLSFLNTGTGLNLLSRSTVLPSSRDLIQCLNASRLKTAKKTPLKLKGVMLLHVRIGDLKVALELIVVDELAVDKFARPS